MKPISRKDQSVGVGISTSCTAQIVQGRFSDVLMHCNGFVTLQTDHFHSLHVFLENLLCILAPFILYKEHAGQRH